MKPLRFAVFVAIAAAALAAGCTQTMQDGKYATNPRGGWDNFRAEAPARDTARAPAG
jgi:hypothetical protein